MNCEDVVVDLLLNKESISSHNQIKHNIVNEIE